MVDLFHRRKQAVAAEGPKAWESNQDWSNPFGPSEAALEEERRKERRRRKEKKIKKKLSRRHKLTEEEYSEMSSKADTMLDELLDDDQASTTPVVEEGKNPFEDTVQEEEGEEIDEEAYASLMGGSVEEQVHLVPVNTQDEAPELCDEDDSILPPPSHYNPFDDDENTVQTDANNGENKSVDESTAYEVASVSDSVMAAEQVESAAPEGQTQDLKRQATETTQEPGESECSESSEEEEAAEEEEEEDVVESSKRLLRMVDERMQYQHYTDEIKALKSTIGAMRKQAEAMSEQLRRAVETKCDLVLAQTELERSHEHHLIAKDDEIRDARLYAQQLLEQQAQNELDFMNEVSTLSMQLEGMKSRNQNEMEKKDQRIAELESKLASVQISETTPESFRSRYIDASSLFGGVISVQ